MTLSATLLALVLQVPLDRLVPPAATTDSAVGTAVAAVDRFVFLGAPGDPWGAPGGGAVDVLERTAAGHEVVQRLFAPTPAAQASFGAALAAEGDTLAVGEPGSHAGAPGGGAVHVFRRAGGSWTHAALLVPVAPLARERFGAGVALAGEWSFVASDPGDGAAGRGHAFRRTAGDSYAYQELIAPGVVAGDRFGCAYTIAGDDELFVGASGRGTSGAVHRFALVDGRWTWRERIVPHVQRPEASFGASLAATRDDLLVGAPRAAAAGVESGAIFVFRRAGGAWRELGVLAPRPPVDGARFGHALATDGRWLFVGAPHDAPAPPGSTLPDAGATWLFERTASADWRLRARLAAPAIGGAPMYGEAGPALLGSAVAIAPPGPAGPGILVSGAPLASIAAPGSGFALAHSHPESAEVSLLADPPALALHTGRTVVLEIRGAGPANGRPHSSAAPSFAGALYLVLGSASGTTPLALGPVELPLVPDAYTAILVADANEGPFVDTFGRLDADGAARAQIVIPPGAAPILGGVTLHHAVLLLDPAGPTPLVASFARRLVLAP